MGDGTTGNERGAGEEVFLGAPENGAGVMLVEKQKL